MSMLPNPPGGNFPRAALTAAAALVGMVVVLVGVLAFTGSLDDRATPLVVSLLGMVATIVPGLVAATYSERASRDIRNGTVVAKAREGTVQALHAPQALAQVRHAAGEALDEKGVLTANGPTASAQLAALTALLQAQAQPPPSPPLPPQTGGSHRAP